MKLRKFKILIAFCIIFFQTFETQINSEESKNLIAEIKWEKFKNEQNYFQPTWIKHDAIKNGSIYSNKQNLKFFNRPFQINSLKFFRTQYLPAIRLQKNCF